MAEAFFHVLFESATSLIESEVGLIMGVDKEMKKLANTLTTIQKVLEDAEHKQFESKAIQYWLSQLTGMAYEIEDILDECYTEVSKLKLKGGKFNLKKILFRYRIGRRMKDAVEKLDVVAEDRHRFHFQETVVQQSNQIDWRRATGSVVNEPDNIYGRDGDRKKIVDMLVNRVSEQRLSVLPIVGIGGLGKTTLAQLIYNDERVNQHFNTKLWVCVSDHFDLIVILKAIVESATGESSNLENLDSLQRRLHQELNEKRYLLILDDVWNDNQEDWFRLKSILACGSTGASIVVTTRLQKVADIMGTRPAYCLTQLLEEHCWILFRLRAFGHDNEQRHGNLENIGRRIVKKCGGVPLAAKALGGLLRFKREEKEWTHVEESHMWNLPQEENSILPVLRLSYRHLPFVLKRCFVYCAVFPKDYVFHKEKLIFHWMAHGCISSNGIQEVEDVGDQIWNELALRSFFQEVDTSGRETTFKMHDLVHDLAQSILENKIPGAETKTDSTKAKKNKMREVHFWGIFSSTITSSIALHVPKLTKVMNYTRLRTLKLNSPRMEELPSAIGKMKHLRYLDLSLSSIRTLPRTLCHLFNLQILVLNHCSDLKSLPENIRFMTNLRHIFLEECSSLSHMPYRIGDLVSLKTLSLFVVGEKLEKQLDELQHLNLGGGLEIKHLEKVQNHINATKANLVEKPNLRDLVFRWEGFNTSSGLTKMMNDEKVLEALEPHLNLSTLEIYGFKGRELAPWMTKMKNLTRISIQNCVNCTHLPPLADLPLLKSLHLRSLDALEYVLEENELEGKNSVSSKFPSLEVLTLEILPNLKGVIKEHEEMGEIFPNLKEMACRYVVPSFCCKFKNLSFLELDFFLLGETTFPEDALEGLCNLERLRVCHAWKHRLPQKWFRGLNSLTKLELSGCRIGSCFPEGWLRRLPALEELIIDGCSELGDMAEEIHRLHLLKRLSLKLVDEMVSLPQGLQHILCLQTLQLNGLEKLASLPDWLPNLSSLTMLEISYCPGILSLPSSIRGMTNLEFLVIRGCPQLEGDCQQKGLQVL